MWDQAKEREESRRIRRLIREILKTGGAGAGTPATAQPPGTSATTSAGGVTALHNRRQSSQFLTSAGTDGGVENSPNLARQELGGFGSTPTTANDGESPGRTMPPSLPPPPPPQQPMTIAQRRLSGQQRAASLDVLSRSLDENGRSGFSSAALGALGEIQRRHSPSPSSGEFAAVPGSAGHKYHSPQQSPGLAGANARPPPAAAGEKRYYAQDHYRHVSSEANVPSNLSPAPGRLSAGHQAQTPGTRDSDGTVPKLPPDDSTRRRNATEGSRPPPAERHSSQETPASAKEHKSFLAKFRRDKRKDDGSGGGYAAEEDLLPASPQLAKSAPYGRLAHQSSET
ncbi:mitogen-activated protein kinase kinase kinase, partial [Teratosphaeriaceae sp. CCFEE 6253]